MSDQVNVVTTLRKLIMEGELTPGEKLAEIPISERLGVSRTPVRLAFRTLEQEGLLRKREKRGYLVREFTANDVHCALEVRGALEGIAARRLAEKGLSPETQQSLQACIDAGSELLTKGYITEEDIDGWSELNSKFHTTIIEASDSGPVADAIARNNHLPFASADSLIIDTKALGREYEKLRFAHVQHQVVLDALVNGEGARVESLMREHAYIGLRYDDKLELLSGNQLYSPSAS